ncbi:MAG: DUF2845 domain-containing protein [Rhodanobacter sp.]
MKRWTVLLAGLLMSLSAMASDSVRFGSQVITVGDSEGKVMRVAGEPERRVQLETKYGGAVGYRLDYDQGRKTVQIIIASGQVVSIAEIYD